MMINMAVAIITVKMKSVTGLDDFVELDEPLYALAFFWLLISGPGRVSVDHLLRSSMRLFPGVREEGKANALPLSGKTLHSPLQEKGSGTRAAS